MSNITVSDENGREYKIDPEKALGEGGQGAVYRVINDKRVAIKILSGSGNKVFITDNQSGIILQDSLYYERLARKIRHIMALDAITGVKNVATPIAMLAEPNCGYVMRFMDGMENISHQMRRANENIVPIVSTNRSLQKKYKVLSKLASIISELNSRGLVYCDFSPGNIFVSRDVWSHEVWLIDMDNLHFSGKSSSIIGTPHYRAPEIADGTGKSNTFYSDIYSFALLAYEYLTLSTPFCGSMSQSPSEDRWDENPCADEDQFGVMVENGDIPFVYEGKGNDPIDESGIPPEYVFTEKVLELFKRTFGEEGRKNPETRPSANEWKSAFEQATDSIYVCSNNHTHLNAMCEWCEYENNMNPNRRARDQNKYFRLISEDYHVERDNAEWDSSTCTPPIRLFSKHELILSHKIDATTKKDIPARFLTNRKTEIDARAEIRSSKITVSIREQGISPSSFSWNYKEDPKGKAFIIKENGIPTKVLTFALGDLQKSAKGDSL